MSTHDLSNLIHQAYVAFNRRDIDGVFALMSEDVDWPMASEGGRAVGKAAIRAYWTRQWAEMDPRVEPVEITELDGGGADCKVSVRVHQVVRSLAGEVLLDGFVFHVHTIADGLIERMDIGDGGEGFRFVQAG